MEDKSSLENAKDTKWFGEAHGLMSTFIVV